MLFRSPSGMFIHLESGACGSGLTNKTLIQAISETFKRQFASNYHYTMVLDCQACGRRFDKVSSWLQHIESPTCSNHVRKNMLEAGNTMDQITCRLRSCKPTPLYVL